MIENRETNPIKDNDKQLPKDEEQELRKEQDDQSNNHLNNEISLVLNCTRFLNIILNIQFILREYMV